MRRPEKLFLVVAVLLVVVSIYPYYYAWVDKVGDDLIQKYTLWYLSPDPRLLDAFETALKSKGCPLPDFLEERYMWFERDNWVQYLQLREEHRDTIKKPQLLFRLSDGSRGVSGKEDGEILPPPPEYGPTRIVHQIRFDSVVLTINAHCAESMAVFANDYPCILAPDEAAKRFPVDGSNEGIDASTAGQAEQPTVPAQ